MLVGPVEHRLRAGTPAARLHLAAIDHHGVAVDVGRPVAQSVVNISPLRRGWRMLRRSFSALPDSFPVELPATTVDFPSTEKELVTSRSCDKSPVTQKGWSKDPVSV